MNKKSGLFLVVGAVLGVGGHAVITTGQAVAAVKVSRLPGETCFYDSSLHDGGYALLVRTHGETALDDGGTARLQELELQIPAGEQETKARAVLSATLREYEKTLKGR